MPVRPEGEGSGLKLQFTVGEDEKAIRIDKYLSEQCPDISRSYLQKLLKTEAVFVGGKPVKSSYKTAAGDLIELEIPEAVEPEIVPEEMELDILYEDSDIILINKPKGMVVHPAAGHYNGTLVNGLMAHCRADLSGINGVMKVHSITRKYYAIVHGVMGDDEGTISGPIGRHPVDRKKMCINEKNGREAVTHYRVLERFRQFTYVECRLETGRTHQIRVHMASIGHPLLGDAVYGPAKCPYKLTGQTLHAGVLGIVHPRTGEYMEFTAPLPEYFEELLRKLRTT